MTILTKTFGNIIVNFFRKYLINQKGCSSNTIAAYSDCIRLLIRYMCRNSNIHADQIDLGKIDETVILDFLDYLEKERSVLPVTRNQRLAALKTFFRFLALEEPTMTAVCERVCSIQPKKTEKKIIESMTVEEVWSIINVPDTTTVNGARDKALLMLLYNTGARVQEIVDLNIDNMNLNQLPQVLLTGKGKKQRIVPLWKETAEALQHYLNLRIKAGIEEKILFLNSKQLRIGRFGIDYIVKKYKNLAAEHSMSLLSKNISPHIFRHSVALHLIQSGISIVTVKEWLGHADIKTTCIYLEINIEMKRKALEKCPPPTGNNKENIPKWKDDKIMTFLLSMGKAGHYVE